MAKYLGPRCRICRRLNMKLFLKGDRCLSEKCTLNRRKAPPGDKPKRLTKLSPYALQLKEKQRLKRIYGLLERQFRITFARASRRKGVTGENLLRLLELRLDNIVYRLNFASSRPMARQLVRHGHILVNGRTVTIPSMTLKPGDVVAVKEKSRPMKCVNDALAKAESNPVPPWLVLDVDRYEGRVERVPQREEIPVPVNEQTVVELYSK